MLAADAARDVIRAQLPFAEREARRPLDEATSGPRADGRDAVAPTTPPALDAAATDALVEAVRRVSREEILPRFRRLDGDEVRAKSRRDDLVTVADERAEAALARAAREILPGAAIVGEEAVEADPGLLAPLDDAPLCVVVDPIDGTWNYANGLAVFGVILAVLARGECVFGLLYDPIGDDWVSAGRGEGSWYHRPGAASRRLAVASPLPLEEVRGSVPLAVFPRERRARVAAGMAKVGGSAPLGCSCHEYRQIALGSLRFSVSPAPKPWDHAAGTLVVREAGGVAVGPDGSDYRPARRTTPLITATDDATARAVAALLEL